MKRLLVLLFVLIPGVAAAQTGGYPTCPKNTLYSNGKCWPMCKPGEMGMDSRCFTDCPSGTTPRYGVCVKGAIETDMRSYLRETSLPGCAPGLRMVNGVCFEPCRPGFTSNAPLCSKPCPKGWDDLELFCVKDGGWKVWETRTRKKEQYLRMPQLPTSCPSGTTNENGLCYAPCKAGYSKLEALCWSTCPPDHYGVAGVCVKKPDLEVRPSYERGPAVAVDRSCKLASFQRGNAPPQKRPFNMLIAADPQIAWGTRTDEADLYDKSVQEEGAFCRLHADTPCPVPGVTGTLCTDECKWKDSLRVNRWMLDAIGKVDTLRWPGSDLAVKRPEGVLVNGDLTAFWDRDEFQTYMALWSNPAMVKLPVYPGLGNHDYANNLDDCTLIDDLHFTSLLERNACAGAAMSFAREMVSCGNVATFPAQKVVGFDLGSGSYSFDIGPIHFVQLHNWPGYAPTLPTPGDGPGWVPSSSALPWLKRDLAMATKVGLKTILNIHDGDDHFKFGDAAELRTVLKGIPVIGVFAGHMHDVAGLRGYWSLDAVHDIPLILSGSPMFTGMLLVEFEPERYKVFRLDTREGNPSFVDQQPLVVETACLDWAKGPGETGVDCGGKCKPCPDPNAPPPTTSTTATPTSTTLTAACVVRDSVVDVPSYGAAASAPGYAKKNLGTVSSGEDAVAQCTEPIFQELTATFCAQNVDTPNWTVATYTDGGAFQTNVCPAGGCQSRQCTTRPALLGACLMRQKDASAPLYDDPESGPLYVMKKLGGVKDVDEVKSRCTAEIRQATLKAYCDARKPEVMHWEAATFASDGSFLAAACQGDVCQNEWCPKLLR